MPDGGFSVARPSMFGNPWRVTVYGLEQSIALHRTWMMGEISDEEIAAGYPEFDAQFLIFRRKTLLAILPLRRGLPMGCYCRMPGIYARDLCHRATLLEVANR